MPKHMHLAQYVMHGPTYHSLAMWRHPRTDRSYDWRRPELYQHIAQVCERGSSTWSSSPILTISLRHIKTPRTWRWSYAPRPHA